MKLRIGDTIPDMPVQTAYGTADSLYGLIGGKNTLIWAVRYIGCPPCHLDTHRLAERYGKFKAANANVVVVMQSDPAVFREATEGETIPFDILCDPEMKFYKALEIEAARDRDEMTGKDLGGLEKLMEKGAACKELGYEHGKYEGDEMQLPAVFVVDGKGTVKYAHYARYIADLPPYDDMVKFMEDLNR